jgi:hypothetical protein
MGDGRRRRAAILACPALGFVVSVPVDVVTKPAITLVIYVWAAALMAQSHRWCRLAGGEVSSTSTDETRTTGAMIPAP